MALVNSVSALQAALVRGKNFDADNSGALRTVGAFSSFFRLFERTATANARNDRVTLAMSDLIGKDPRVGKLGPLNLGTLGAGIPISKRPKHLMTPLTTKTSRPP